MIIIYLNITGVLKNVKPEGNVDTTCRWCVRKCVHELGKIIGKREIRGKIKKRFTKVGIS